MNKTLVMCAAILFSIRPALSQGANISGNDLLSACKGSTEAARSPIEAYKQGICLGMASSTFLGANTLNANSRFCAPKGVTVGQAMKVAVSYMEAHPQSLQMPLHVLLLDSYRAAWPCN
jgi:hypothetical protein